MQGQRKIAELLAQPSTADVRRKLADTVVERGTIVPLATYSDGTTRAAWPAMLHDPARGFDDVMTGRTPLTDATGRTSQQAIKAAADVGGAAMTGGLGLGIAGGMMPRNAVAIFGGRIGAENLAKTGEARPQRMLQMLDDMERAGASRDEIWAATAKVGEGTPYAGAMRGVDKQGRFEIDDSAAKFIDSDVGTVRPLPQALRHNSLYGAYPSMRGIDYERRDLIGGWNDGKRIASGGVTSAAKSTALHEAQHSAQGIEGFARGGNLTTASRIAAEPAEARIKELQKDYIDLGGKVAGAQSRHDQKSFWTTGAKQKSQHQVDELIAREAGVRKELSKLQNRPSNTPEMAYAENPIVARALYNMLAGEVEARTVQKRMNLTADQRRARPPWLDYDVSEANQIIRAATRDPSLY